MIQAKKVSKSFGSRKVLQALDFHLQPGEIVALVGLNGAGKTSLIRLLSGLSKPETGSIDVDGIPLVNENPEVRARLGVVLHTSMLYNQLTCRENLEFYSQLYDTQANQKRVGEMLELMGLETRANDQTRTLSRGMQQRLSVARALLHDPAYLLMDEVFTGMDQPFVSRFIEIMKQKASAGKGILFSSHDLDRISEVATRMAILHSGNIAFSEPIKDLSSLELVAKYRELTETPLKS